MLPCGGAGVQLGRIVVACCLHLACLSGWLARQPAAPIIALLAEHLAPGQTSADHPCLAAYAASQLKQQRSRHGYGVHESLEELGRLADTAGLEVVGSTYQLLDEASWLGLVLGQLEGATHLARCCGTCLAPSVRCPLTCCLQRTPLGCRSITPACTSPAAGCNRPFTDDSSPTVCHSDAQVNPRTYIGSGKVQEIMSAVANSGATTVVFDDELSPGAV